MELRSTELGFDSAATRAVGQSEEDVGWRGESKGVERMGRVGVAVEVEVREDRATSRYL